MQREHNGNRTAVYILYAAIMMASWLLFGNLCSDMLGGTQALVIMGLLLLPEIVRGLGKEWAKGVKDAS